MTRNEIIEACGYEPEEIFRREATSNGGSVSVYLGDGVYWRAQMPEGGSTKAIEMTDTPIPRPRARRNRVWVWHRGAWQAKAANQAKFYRELGYVVA